jgi:MFS transporter, putative metabolite:H+ symporter
MELSLLAFLMPELSKQWPDQDGSFWKPMTSSVTFVGVFIGSFVWGRISDRYGRRLANLGTNLVIGIFGLLTAFAPNFAFVAISRFCAGLGMGGTTVAFALYVEHLPIKRRGSYLVLFSFWWTLGIVLQSLLAALYLADSSPDSWRHMVAVSSLPFFILAAAYKWIPESPHWLVLTGKKQDAAYSLRWMAAVNGKSLPHSLSLRDHSLEADTPNLKESLATLFGPTLRLITILLLTMWFAMNLAYYGAVLFTPGTFIAPAHRFLLNF